MDFQNYTWNPNVGPDQLAEQHSLIDDLFFGFEAPNLNDLIKGDTGSGQQQQAGRTRRVTISEEITGEDETGSEWLMVAGSGHEDEAYSSAGSGSDNDEATTILTTDEIFQILDESVQDWKTNLEIAVGEGLKKLRKASKDSKLKIKYLPGESIGNKKLIAPKNQILKEWRDEFESAIQNVQSKLDKLARDKMAEVAKVYQEKLIAKSQKADQKKKITIDCRDAKKSAGSHQSLKQMVRELDKMVAATQATNFDNCVPIYSMNPAAAAPEANKANVVATQYEFPLQKYLKYLKEANVTGPANPFQQPIVDNPKPKVDLKQFVANNQSQIMDALDDMKLTQMKKPAAAEEPKPAIKEPKVKQTLFKDDLLKKEIRRETSAISKRSKMVERRTKRKKRDATITNQGFTYRLRQYSVNGEEHYLIVKKKIPSNEEVEDIFEDWCHNLTVRKPKNRIQPRVRKLSHRAQRKEYLKENSYPIPKTGPISYADALKKNLKYRPNYIPAEDVFEAWRDCLDGVGAGGAAEAEMRIQPHQQEQVLLQSTERTMDIEHASSLIECGQPTVRTTHMTSKNDGFRGQQAVKSTTTAVMVSSGGTRGLANSKKALQPEQIFAGWRHNLNDEEFLPKRLPKIGKKYAVEEIFRTWRRNFYVKEQYNHDQLPTRRQRSKNIPRMKPENIFNGWIHNFNVKPTRPYKRGGRQRVWRRNLYEKQTYPPRRIQQLRPMPENVFNDWLHNFNAGSEQRHHHHRHHNHHSKHQPNVAGGGAVGGVASGGEPLSKKSRNNTQRRSKNKKQQNKNDF